jgi:hypothetical protein
MASEPPPLAPEDLALLERLAARIVDLRLEVPAILALETSKPLALLASQAMIFFEPIAQALFPGPDYRRLARLVEKREAMETLATLIERRAEQMRAERRAARAARKAR